MIKSTTTKKIAVSGAPGVGSTYFPLPLVTVLTSIFITAVKTSDSTPLNINVRVNGDVGDQSIIFSGSTVRVLGDVGEISVVEVNGPVDFTVTFVMVE